jgi:hypothetical protein
MKKELRDCPHCADEGKPKLWEKCGSNEYNFVSCEKCGADAKGSFEVDQAIEHWNCRPIEDTLRQDLQAVKAERDAALRIISSINFASVEIEDDVRCAKEKAELITNLCKTALTKETTKDES